jgi:hypothetical protein
VVWRIRVREIGPFPPLPTVQLGCRIAGIPDNGVIRYSGGKKAGGYAYHGYFAWPVCRHLDLIPLLTKFA